MLCLLSTALALNVALYAPEGQVQAGSIGLLELAIVEDGRPLSLSNPYVEAAAGILQGTWKEVSPGRYQAHWLAPGLAGTVPLNLVFNGERYQGEVEVVQLFNPSSPISVEGVVGSGPVALDQIGRAHV